MENLISFEMLKYEKGFHKLETFREVLLSNVYEKLENSSVISPSHRAPFFLKPRDIAMMPQYRLVGFPFRLQEQKTF